MGFVNSGGSLGMALKVGVDCKPTGIVNIPYGVTNIPYNLFVSNENITEVYISDTVQSIQRDYYDGCAFRGCRNLKTLSFGYGLKTLPAGVSDTNGSSLENIINKYPNTVFNSSSFSGNTGLINFITPTNFNPTDLNLSDSPEIAYYSMYEMFNKLVTIATPKTITLGTTNLAKMTTADKAIATNKGWTLA